MSENYESVPLLQNGDGLFFRQNPDGSSVLRASLSIVASIAGAGVLGLPQGLMLSGWVGVILIVIVTFMANYTAKILLKSMFLSEKAAEKGNYHEIAEAAFGRAGVIAALVIQNFTLFAAGVLFLILAGENITDLFRDWHALPKVTSNDFILIAAAICLPFLLGLKTMKEVSWIAVLGMASTTFAVFVIVFTPFFHDKKKEEVKPTHSVFNASSLAMAFEVFVFAFGGHNVFPAIGATMKDTRRYDTMLNLAFAIVLALYIPPAIIGYYFYGNTVQSPILKSLPVGVPVYLATIAITVHLLLTIPILNNPLFLWVEDILGVEKHKLRVVFRCILRTLIVGAQALIACKFKYFEDVMGIIGATGISATVFFFPCFIYLKLNWKNETLYSLAWNYFILICASVGSIIGLEGSLLSLYNDINNTHHVLSPKVFYSVLGGCTAFAAIAISLVFWLIGRSAWKNDQKFTAINDS